ncbi:Glyceraldehyde-3-phosphate dehydrogenase, partial [Galemys pyrenaicus]
LCSSWFCGQRPLLVQCQCTLRHAHEGCINGLGQARCRSPGLFLTLAKWVLLLSVAPSSISTTWSTCPWCVPQCKFNGTVKVGNRKLVINRKTSSIFPEQDPNRPGAGLHVLWAREEYHDSRKRCLLHHPLRGPLAKVITTTLAPGGLVTTVCAITAPQKTNTLPTSPGATTAVGKAILELNGKPPGTAFLSPPPACRLWTHCPPEKSARCDNIKKTVEQASEDPSRASRATLRTRLSRRYEQ